MQPALVSADGSRCIERNLYDAVTSNPSTHSNRGSKERAASLVSTIRELVLPWLKHDPGGNRSGPVGRGRVVKSRGSQNCHDSAA